MSCEPKFLASNGNTWVFIRVHGQVGWTRADLVKTAQEFGVAAGTVQADASVLTDDWQNNQTVQKSITATIKYLATTPVQPTDVVIQSAYLLGVCVDMLEVTGDYPSGTGAINAYTLGTYRVANTGANSTPTDLGSRTVTLVLQGALQRGDNLTTVDSPDPIPPTVTLVASSTVITTNTTLTLTATASDNVGVFKVEFWEGSTLLGTDFSGTYDWTIPLTSANNGTYMYTAKAYDAAGNVTTSNIVGVTVNISSSMYPAGMIYGLTMMDVVGGQLIPLPEAENQTPANILGGTVESWGMNALRATWDFGDPNLLAANGSEGLTYYVVSRLDILLGAWSYNHPVLTDINGAYYRWTQSAIHFVRDYWGTGSYNKLGWFLGRGGSAPASDFASAEIISPKPEPSAFGIGSAILRVAPTFGGAPSAVALGLKATSPGGTYDQSTPTNTNPSPATLTPPGSILGIGTTADNLDQASGGPYYLSAGVQTFCYLLIFRGVHDLATETAVIAQMRAELALRGVVLP